MTHLRQIELFLGLVICTNIIFSCRPEVNPEETVSILPNGELLSDEIGLQFIDEKRKEIYYYGGFRDHIRMFNWETKKDTVLFPGYKYSAIYLIEYLPSIRQLFFAYSIGINSFRIHEINVETFQISNHLYLRDMNPKICYLDDRNLFYNTFGNLQTIYKADYKGNKELLPIVGELKLKVANAPEIVVHNSRERSFYIYDFHLDSIVFEREHMPVISKFYNSELGILMQNNHSDLFHLYHLKSGKLMHEIGEKMRNPKFYFKPECMRVYYQIIREVGYNKNNTDIYCENILTKEITIPFEIVNGSSNQLYQFNDCQSMIIGSTNNIFLSRLE